MDPEREARLESIVHQAAGLAGDARATYLDAACASDAELRREVESLLVGLADASQLLETPAWVAHASPLEPGTKLGPYEITGQLGAGGMGEVYEARDTRLGRTVAIKVLPRGAASDPERRRRFEHEARAASALNHPHICTLFDVGEAVPATPRPAESGGTVTVSFLVLERIEGETLAARLERGPLPAAEALEVAAQIADALGAAHRAGIVHRDLKPGNVMLAKSATPGDDAVQIKLLDFGLAKLQATDAELPATRAQSSVTMAGMLIGTLPYMAPEQLAGRPADARADVWAFGCVLYEMLAGRRAFAGDTPATLAASILEREPEPLDDLALETPPPVVRLVAQCLSKNPADRPQDATELRTGLQSVPRRRPDQASDWRRRVGPVLSAVLFRRPFLTAVVAGSVLLGAAWLLAVWRPSPIPLDVQERYAYGGDRCAETSEIALAAGIAALQDVVARAPAFAAAHGQLAFCLALKANFAAEQASAVLELARRHAEEAIALDAGLATAHAASTWVKLMRDRDWPGADASSRRAVEADPASAYSWNARSAYLMAVGNFDDAAAALQRAMRLNPRSPLDAMNYGYSLLVAGRPEEAIAHFRGSLKRFPDHDLMTAELAWALLATGQVDEALTASAEARKQMPAGTAAIVDVWLNRVEYLAGDQNRARRLADEWAERAGREWVDPHMIAKLFAGIDDTDRTVVWLERAWAEKSANLFLLNAWFHLHPKVYADPRVREITRRLKLPDPMPAGMRPPARP